MNLDWKGGVNAGLWHLSAFGASLLAVAETGGIPSLAGVWELNSSFHCNFSVSVLLLLYSTDPCIGTLGHFPISGVVPHQFLIFTDLTTSHNLCTDSSRHESWLVCHRPA